MDNQELRWYLAMLGRWLWLIAICALLGGGVAFAVSSQAIPVYRATTTLLVSYASSSNMSDYTAVMLSERMAQTYSAMLTGRPVLQVVIDRLGLGETPDELATRISVAPVPDTQLLRLSVTHPDPALAAQIANEVAAAFASQNQDLQQDRYSESLASLQEQMSLLSATMGETQAAITAIGSPATAEEQAELSRLDTVQAGYRNTYAILVQNYEQMRIVAAQSGDNLVVVEPAEPPAQPVGSGKLRNTAVAMVAGAVLAIGVAFLVEYLDDTLKTPDEIERILGLETLGVIGQLGKEEPEMIVPQNPHSPLSEAYRALRTNIRFASVDKPLHTLLVTSANVTEGKSITVANLAASMAETELKVVTVDADLRRPRLHQLFNISRAGGLTQALLDGRVDGAVQPAMYLGRLGVLPCGELPPNPAELLGSSRMRQLLAELSAQVDIVLIDSPPVLPVADAAILAPEVDGVLLVINAGQTRRGAALRAIEVLRQVGANVLGVVLNAVPMDRGRYYYYYYYYYRGEESREGARSRRRRRGGLLGALEQVFPGKKRRRRSSSSRTSGPRTNSPAGPS